VIESGIYSRLVAGVPSVSGRVYPMILPQNVVFPCVSYLVISDPGDQDHDGPTLTRSAGYQVSAWARTFTEARTAAAQIRTALEGYRGTMGTVDVATVIADGGRDLYDDDLRIYHHAGDFTFLYKE
jgi:hypothetical protein